MLALVQLVYLVPCLAGCWKSDGFLLLFSGKKPVWEDHGAVRNADIDGHPKAGLPICSGHRTTRSLMTAYTSATDADTSTTAMPGADTSVSKISRKKRSSIRPYSRYFSKSSSSSPPGCVMFAGCSTCSTSASSISPSSTTMSRMDFPLSSACCTTSAVLS